MNINFQSRFSAQWNTPFRVSDNSALSVSTTSVY